MFGRSKPIRVEVFAKTDLGRTRDHNEDRFLVADLTRKTASLQPDVRQHDIGPRGTLLERNGDRHDLRAPRPDVECRA